MREVHPSSFLYSAQSWARLDDSDYGSGQDWPLYRLCENWPLYRLLKCAVLPAAPADHGRVRLRLMEHY